MPIVFIIAHAKPDRLANTDDAKNTEVFTKNMTVGDFSLHNYPDRARKDHLASENRPFMHKWMTQKCIA